MTTEELAKKHTAHWHTPEVQALCHRVMFGDPSSDDLFDVAKLELRDALDVCSPFAPDNGRPIDSFHAGCCASRVMSYLDQVRKKMSALATERDGALTREENSVAICNSERKAVEERVTKLETALREIKKQSTGVTDIGYTGLLALQLLVDRALDDAG